MYTIASNAQLKIPKLELENELRDHGIIILKDIN